MQGAGFVVLAGWLPGKLPGELIPNDHNYNGSLCLKLLAEKAHRPNSHGLGERPLCLRKCACALWGWWELLC